MKPKLKLVGKEGNSFAIIGLARRVAIRAGWSKEQIDQYTEEATSSDYNNLLTVTCKYFEVS